MQVESPTAVEPKRVLPQAARRKFKIVLIKPSHYDADGYVIQWWRSTIPSNSLASVYGLLANARTTRARPRRRYRDRSL